MVRVLMLATRYPNRSQPNLGVAVEKRLLQTLALGGMEATVIAPTPFFPSWRPMFGRYARLSRVPRREIRQGVTVLHPRYLTAPGMSGAWTAQSLFRAALRSAQRLQAAGERFDVIDAHCFYPDGVAAAQLGRVLRAPVVITGRGAELTLLPRSLAARRQIVWASQEASASVAVCEDLRRRLVALGAPEERTLTLRNGVDLDCFSLGSRAEARMALGVSGFVMASVGSLIPRKGHALAIEALRELRDGLLLIVGAGPQRAELGALARRLGLSERVRFLGELPHAELPRVYQAADVLVLASEREGWGNVLLEAMACGAPVVATDVNGASEIVRARAAGLLVRQRSAQALARAVMRLRLSLPRREDTRAYAEAFGWGRVAAAHHAMLEAAARLGYEHRHSVQIARDARRRLVEDIARAS